MNTATPHTQSSPPNFIERLRAQHIHNGLAADEALAPAPNLQQWLQYWNDEESYAGNLRNFHHWLMRARISKA